MCSNDIGLLENDIFFLRQEIVNLKNNIAQVNAACQVSISDLQVELSAEISSQIDEIRQEQALDFRTTHDDVVNMQHNFNRLRQELILDKVVERVFGDKGE